MPDYKQTDSEVLSIVTNKTLKQAHMKTKLEHIMAAGIHKDVVTAHCLEIMERSVYEFGKRVTRPSAKSSGKPQKKQTPSLPFSKEMPRVLPEKGWAGKQFMSQNIPKAVHNHIVCDLQGLPKGLYAA